MLALKVNVKVCLTQVGGPVYDYTLFTLLRRILSSSTEQLLYLHGDMKTQGLSQERPTHISAYY